MNLSYGFLCFNNWPILKRTLESAKKLKHTQGDVQWVIVDNSTPEFCDEMEKGIAQWCKDNPDIHVDMLFNHGENAGEGGGMNQCFEHCLGDHILFFQDDWECVVDYNFIDLGVEVLDKFPHVFMVQLSKRPWSTTNPNVKMGRVLINRGDLVACEMQPNGYGNNTFQVRLFKKSTWRSVGAYPDKTTIDFKKYAPGTREGSIGEYEYGLRLASLGYCAAKINDGQFIHTIPENARNEYFITQ